MELKVMVYQDKELVANEYISDTDLKEMLLKKIGVGGGVVEIVCLGSNCYAKKRESEMQDRLHSRIRYRKAIPRANTL